MNMKQELQHLIASRENGNMEAVAKASFGLVTSKEVTSFIEKFVENKWNRYGIEDLRFVYAISTKKSCEYYLLDSARKCFEKIDADYVSKNADRKNFAAYFLATRLAGYFKEWFLMTANEKLPELTRRNIDDFQHIQLVTDYAVNFRTQTNEEILLICENHGMHYTAKKMETLRSHFGYNAIERGWWRVAKNRAKAEKYHKLGIAELTNESIDKCIEEIRDVLNYSVADVSVLRNWLYRLVETGNDKNDVEVTDSLKERYEFKKVFPGKNMPGSKDRADCDSAIFGRMRAEVRTAFEDGKLSPSAAQAIISANYRCTDRVCTVA